MKLSYKTYTATVTFCRITRCFYGEVDNSKHGGQIFIASCKLALYNAMQQAIDHYTCWVIDHSAREGSYNCVIQENT